MQDITEIMNMLDWHKPPEVQSKGIALAENAETVRSFIQPLTPEHNKNVWENCAVIIAEKSDEKLDRIAGMATGHELAGCFPHHGQTAKILGRRFFT